MNEKKNIQILPYSKIVGQEDLKLALEIAYIAGPRISGVLISGHRGTGKSTTVRAFAKMIYGDFPVTLPINVTEDRVIGGWNIDALMAGKPKLQKGLLAQANNKILYIDEVNLLDDHIVNIILDAAATGILEVQRQGINIPPQESRFILVGTMNPEEGHLRPQLQDRFGLMVQVSTKQEYRAQILKTVLEFDLALSQHTEEKPNPFIKEGLLTDKKIKSDLELSKKQLNNIKMPKNIAEKCIVLAEAFNAVGHRGDYVMALAAKALAAREKSKDVTISHLKRVAPFSLIHRRFHREEWTKEDTKKLEDILSE